jgi:hypothetical protein
MGESPDGKEQHAAHLCPAQRGMHRARRRSLDGLNRARPASLRTQEAKTAFRASAGGPGAASPVSPQSAPVPPSNWWTPLLSSEGERKGVQWARAVVNLRMSQPAVAGNVGSKDRGEFALYRLDGHAWLLPAPL